MFRNLFVTLVVAASSLWQVGAFNSSIGVWSANLISDAGLAIPDDQLEDYNHRMLASSWDKNRPVTCQKSFEPTCDMYHYVRFWNKEFHAEDCYDSPLRPTAKSNAKWEDKKYVVFQPDVGGWNNIRMGAETVILFAHATGRTLVLPPMMKFYLLNKNHHDEDNQSGFQKFFDFKKISEGLDVVSMEDFIENVAKKGLLQVPFPNGLSVLQKKNLWNYMIEACHMHEWNFDKFFFGFNIDSSGLIGAIDAQSKDPRFTEISMNKRKVIPYDARLDEHRALFFPGEGPNRMLVHYYAYLYWADPHVEQIYKRIVRDRLHYHDDIFCSAGRVVRMVHQDAAKITGKPIPTESTAHPKTLGGNTNQDATYHAFHIRRGDFQYKETRISGAEIWAKTRHLLDPSVSTLIYIATDEHNKTEFSAFMQPPFTVRFLDNYLDLHPHRQGRVLNLNHVGMMEQVICANAHTFIGTPLSTFTGYITRMRGYYRDGRYARTYYTLPGHQYVLQQQPTLTNPMWGREFSKAHKDIDDFWQ